MDYPRTLQDVRDSPKLLRNKDGEELGRRIKPPAGPELRVQTRDAPTEHTQSLPSKSHPHCVQVCLYIKTDLFRVCRGAEHLKLTSSHHPQAHQSPYVTQNCDSLASCSLLPLLIRSPTVLYNAKIIFLLPMQIMSEPSTLPCLMQKAAPQGRGGPGCSYKAY